MNTTSNRLAIMLFLWSLLFLPSSQLFAQAPSLINYQGRLLDGTNLVNGNVGLALRLYNVTSGGPILYEDSNTVTVVDGLYDTVLGDNTAPESLVSVLTNDQVWLEVVVDGIPLAPRERLVGVPYALATRGLLVTTNLYPSVIAGGQDNRIEGDGFGGFIAAGTSNAVGGRGSFAGGNRAKATNSQSFVWADGTAADFGTTTSNQFLIRASAGVGIGTNVTTPGGLTVAGAVSAASFSGSGSGITNLSGASLTDGAITADKLAADSVTAAAIADGAVSADKLNADQMAVRLLMQIGNPATVSTGFAADALGSSVARVGGDRILAGMPGDDTAAFTDAGSIHLYNMDGTLFSSITNPLPGAGSQFGYAVAGISTTHFVVASMGSNAGSPRTNEVYVFNANGSLLNRITLPEQGAEPDWNASLIGLGSDRFVIGQPFHISTGAIVGIARMYNTSGALLATITNPAPGIDDLFGNALAAVGTNRFVVGCWLDDVGANDAGAAYLYSMDGTLVATITNPVPVANASFGASVAGVGTDGFAVGAYGQDKVYIYNNGGVLQQTITNAAGPSFGFGGVVAGLGTNKVLIYDFTAEPGGLVYVYDLSGVLLAAIQNPSGGAGRFGSAMADVGSGRWAISDHDDEGRVIGAGSVYIFDTVMTVSGLVAESAATLIGTLDPSKFSAYADLSEEGFLDANNTGDLMTRFFADQRYINTNDTLDAPVGSASSPTYGFSGDSNTGIYQPAADQVAVSAGGMARLIVDSSGAIGIGTTNPLAPLHVSLGSAGPITPSPATSLLLEGDTNNMFASFLTAEGAATGILFGSPINEFDSSIRYNFFGRRELIFRTLNSTKMIIETNGFVGIGTTSPTNRLHVNGTVQATAYITGSDRNVKENIQPVAPEDILAKVVALPIATWTFKEEANGTHIGPMAQDFHAAFGFGNTDTGIMTVDADGVALAAIQALAKEKEQLEEKVLGFGVQMSELEKENRVLREELEAIKRRIGM